MINLRHLLLPEDAPISHMPLGFSNLTSLHTLPVFFVGKGVGCKLNELHGLIHLEGQLMIKNIKNVRDARDCAEVNLREKKRLDILKFSWTDQESIEGDSREEMDESVLQALQPHSDLKILEIESYGGSRFASWMREQFLPNLLEVSLVKCRNVKNLPPLGELPLLRDLMLKEMDAVKCIEDIGQHRSKEWFPSLKKLTLESLSNLMNWIFQENSAGSLSCLPSLIELTITGCPRLESMPVLPSVEKLEVNCCCQKLVQSLLSLPEGKATPSSLTRLKYLKIEECSDLIFLPKNWSQVLISLENLVIENCTCLITLDDQVLGYRSSLTSLKISELPNLVSLPQWMQNLNELQQLWISGCDVLVDMPDWIWELTSVRDLRIVRCHQLKSLPDGVQSLPALEILTIGNCDSLLSWPNGLGNLVSLKELFIICSSNLPSLPEQLQQLTGLHELGIVNCETMLSLPEWLGNFTSLQIFLIYGFKNLQCLPNWFPKLNSLDTLYISKCDELTSRCQKGTGVDWPNIAHLPNILLDDKWIQQA